MFPRDFVNRRLAWQSLPNVSSKRVSISPYSEAPRFNCPVQRSNTPSGKTTIREDTTFQSAPDQPSERAPGNDHERNASPIYIPASDIHFGRLTTIIMHCSSAAATKSTATAPVARRFILFVHSESVHERCEQIAFQALHPSIRRVLVKLSASAGPWNMTDGRWLVAENSNEMKWQNLIRCQESYPTSVRFSFASAECRLVSPGVWRFLLYLSGERG